VAQYFNLLTQFFSIPPPPFRISHLWYKLDHHQRTQIYNLLLNILYLIKLAFLQRLSNSSSTPLYTKHLSNHYSIYSFFLKLCSYLPQPQMNLTLIVVLSHTDSHNFMKAISWHYIKTLIHSPPNLSNHPSSQMILLRNNWKPLYKMEITLLLCQD
jgi:hypothetical protein